MTRMPQVTAKEIVSFLKKQGFAEIRQSGSHLTMFHEERRVAVTVPIHTGCDLGRGLATRILKDAGFSAEDFSRLR
jgi:predicted RNA binding protein YcfA (HicA-like mRNA interferase family)